MKFTCITEINSPINKVAELFGNTNNLKKWQPGLVSYETFRGNAGEVGAKAKIIFNHRNQTMELTETIMVNNLPEELTALYEHKHMTNTMSNRFTPINANQTKMQTDIHYTKFNGFMPKMMALLLPGVFKKQTQKSLDNFKDFVEKS
jgi:uncharacterized membrane protein